VPETPLRERIDAPEHVQKGTFVLRLAEGVIDPGGALRLPHDGDGR
jgi:hypothetical protein